jgi:GAF domain-containing protein
MRRGAKPGKAKVKARLPVVRKSPNKEASGRRELEKRLAESLEREKATSEILQEKDRELTEALAQQTATADILSSISASPTDYQPVFDTIVRNAGSVCGAVDAMLWTADGDELVVRAHHGPIPGTIGSRQPVRGSVAGRAVSEARVVHVEDLTEADDFPVGRDIARRHGWRTTLSVPLLLNGAAAGAILIRRSDVRLFTPKEIALLKTFADQAVIAIENVRLFNELEGRNRDLTATSEILRVISSSPTDVQPVFDTVVDSARRLLDGHSANVLLVVEGALHLAALTSTGDVGDAAVRANFPAPMATAGVAPHVIKTRRPYVVTDTETDPLITENIRRTAPLRGYRSMLFMPLIRDEQAIGLISVTRRSVGTFSDNEIGLLKTFADQAVIAIENVRLFNETKAALEQQTATSEILGVISSSPTDVQPVLDVVAENAAKVCGASDAIIFRAEGDLLRRVAHFLSVPVSETPDSRHIDRESLAGRVVIERTSVQIADISDEMAAREFPETARHARRVGHRTLLGTPLMREGVAIGVIVILRTEVRPFNARQVALLETFADQAVIAIENVRLFNETKEALEQQTATSEILGVISSSPTDVKPVFQTILSSTNRLCEASFSVLWLWDGEALIPAAHANVSPELVERLRTARARPRRGGSPVALAALEQTVIHVPDVLDDPRFSPADVPSYQLEGARSILSVPMLREGNLVGVINTWRREPRAFTNKQVELLKTFANQAVIAIENVRLFTELQARTTELTRSVEQLTALGEISQAVSSTLDVETVLQTIVSRATQLAGADGCAIYEYDDATEAFHIRATHNLDPVLVGTLRATPLRKGEGAMGRAAETREPTQIADIEAPGAYQSHIRDTLLGAGYRALLSVPLLREGEVIGSLSLNRHAPGEFPPEVIDVLKTFATQSALAIQNARLFREIADKSRQLEVASRHKSEFLANMSHELRTPLNAIIGFSEVLVDRMFGELNEKQDEYLKDIFASGQHLLSLINDILDLSKIEAGRMELEVSDFDLPSAIDNALILVRERASRRGITLGHSVDERLGQIRGDERKVKQVLLNLLSNALKFTPEGGRIDVSARVRDEVAEVSVTDTGVGIAPEDQEAVFEEFRQVGTADKKVEGTGLGLALSRKFIELHGGRIWVKSLPGQGSTFTFTLPVRRED